METVTDGKLIALAINAISNRGFDRKLKDIFVEPQRRLTNFTGNGWKVFFVFDDEDDFLRKSLTVEVSNDGHSAVFESM